MKRKLDCYDYYFDTCINRSMATEIINNQTKPTIVIGITYH